MTTSIKKVALITGAATGIGKSIAIHLAKDGISIAVNYIRDSKLADEVVNEIRQAGGTAVAFSEDVSKVAAIVTLFENVIQEFGGIDIVVANAGIAMMGMPIIDVTEADFDRINKEAVGRQLVFTLPKNTDCKEQPLLVSTQNVVFQADISYHNTGWKDSVDLRSFDQNSLLQELKNELSKIKSIK